MVIYIGEIINKNYYFDTPIFFLIADIPNISDEKLSNISLEIVMEF